MESVSLSKNNRNSKIAKNCLKILFVDEKKWNQSDDCADDEITGNNIIELPIILANLWKSIVNDIEKEGKNANIIRASNAILEAILNRNVYSGFNCTLSGAKSHINKNKYFTKLNENLKIFILKKYFVCVYIFCKLVHLLFTSMKICSSSGSRRNFV
ncbi:hypothetical protein RFI_04308 [Reticulomyxa filosa]|uniref:Uncharacterized protein n=1 Tax=Reticulomyxa filosa TaxID=46433 RepID=X6P3V2_RETFI|nr:hypothetical protein RFI_04308 [Reticulomyxa filosa]|eukprot:ETO32808.1 hypothetical protein RFI_04308 [Reticulomyxa filosa]